ncbi:hypothetical protein D1816_08375 [Aquimarina sp. AD10]|uniref:Dual-action HEIGH metallo-peptidase n=1 Tax=Aquimarina aggregata TaxID=1642818 RepID=A0A162XW14_9FLAO|nr:MULTISPECIES: M57 family metalloprotease [Aquimarina]AXT60365.1 hypothetical protein D1816_08375 [Aquimarina sp. AD10]KZS38803.1 hypothetical protein AWE51_14560 [Aquimarina aggregata]RKN01201.1 hypothetical protein D7033_05105 [Aquimarina sp. AD10]
MKINLLKTRYLLMATSFLLILNSCETEDTINQEEMNTTTIALNETQLNALKLNGITPESNIVEEFKETILGESIEGLLISDNFISYKELDQMIENTDQKLFFNKSRITLPKKGKRMITVGVVTSGSQGLDNKQRNAAQTVIHRYKSLNLKKIDFRILIGVNNFGNTRPDIVIISSDSFTSGGFDGRARFPENGNPGDLIGINTRTQGSNWPQSELVSLIMHELGHAIGFVHADYKTRRSCIPFGLEDAGDFSDNQVDLIPGTNSSGDYINSIMRACNFYAIGDFTAEDKKAMRRAYNGQSF